jgi:hypothetical protein
VSDHSHTLRENKKMHIWVENEFIYRSGQNWGERYSQSVSALPIAMSQLTKARRFGCSPGSPELGDGLSPGR